MRAFAQAVDQDRQNQRTDLNVQAVSLPGEPARPGASVGWLRRGHRGSELPVLVHAAQRIGDAKECTPFRKHRQSYTPRLVRNTEILLQWEGHG
jgi:hypothetical protein